MIAEPISVSTSVLFDYSFWYKYLKQKKKSNKYCLVLKLTNQNKTVTAGSHPRGRYKEGARIGERYDRRLHA